MDKLSYRNRIHEILLGDNDDRYQELCEYVCAELSLKYLAIERIYMSRGEYVLLAKHGFSDTKKAYDTIPVSALGHPNLGRITYSYNQQTQNLEREIGYISDIIVKQFQIDWMKNLMNILATRILWDDNEVEYLDELASVCRKSASASHIAIREETETELKATAWNSYNTSINFNAIRSISKTQKIGKIIHPPRESDRVNFHGPKSELVEYMRSHLNYQLLDVIISMPIFVQGQRVGAINFAYDHEFTLSPTMRSGLNLLSNVIGTALQNYRLRNTIELNARKIFWSGRQALNYELMQGYRHWAGHSVDDLDSGLAILYKTPQIQNGIDINANIKKKIDLARDELHDALKNMENLSAGYRLDRRETSLNKMFQSAGELLKYEIERDEITLLPSRLGDSLFGNEDSLRAVFLNLILNSIQAFRANKQKKGTIKLVLSTEKDRVLFTYADNGPGLRLNKNLKNQNDIWLPEVSTKEKGTGFGMPMVRQVIQSMHGGDINLASDIRRQGFSVAGHVLRDGFKESNWGK